MTKQDRRDGESLDSLLRKFKRKVKNDGKLTILKSKERYEKPSERKKRDHQAAKRRTYLQQQQDIIT